MNKPLLKPVNLPRPPRPVDPNRVGEGKSSYKAEVMPLWENERVGDLTHRAFFFIEEEGKQRRELMRRLGRDWEEALDALVLGVETSSGLTRHARFVRPAAQALREEVRQAGERKARMFAALLATDVPKNAAEVQLREEARRSQNYDGGNVGLAEFLTGQGGSNG